MTMFKKIVGFAFKALLVCYLAMWSIQINMKKEKYVALMRINLRDILELVNVQGKEAYLEAINIDSIATYTHLLVAIAFIELFSWKITKVLRYVCILANLLLLWDRSDLLFIGMHLILLGVAI